MATTVMWFRRDLRLDDNPALAAAAEAGDVVPLFVHDDRLRGPSGANRLAFLDGCLRALDESTGGALVVRHGNPADVVAAVVAECDAERVVVAADFGPYGAARDDEVAQRLPVELTRVGSPYAVGPGTLTKSDGTPYQVFSAFHRAWKAQGVPNPIPAIDHVRWTSLRSDAVPPAPPAGASLPEPGEAAAKRRLVEFVEHDLARYADGRNLPAAEATSRLSPYLKWGCVHPRTVLAAVAGRRSRNAERFRTEVAWRDFYADVLWHRPDSARTELQPALRDIDVDRGPSADARFDAWVNGCTGYPLVDAGMRQLLREGWMHNRVRMLVASFLVKDLHLPWQRGARHFHHLLVDADLASNSHGWQWVAGTGTDPAPYVRVFNPVLQSQKFDPQGAYIRRYVHELADLRPDEIHEPWKLAGGPPNGYPPPIVDHAAERREALARYDAVRAG